MEKILTSALALIMVLSLSACGNSEESKTNADGGKATTAATEATTDGAPQLAQTEAKSGADIVNASEEAWVSSSTNIAYIFLADGKHESYTLDDGVWKTNGNGTYNVDGDKLTIDSTVYDFSVTDDTLTFTVKDKNYAYVRTSPFNPEQPSEVSLDEKLVLADGQAWIEVKNGLINGYVFNADGTYSFNATDSWITQSSGTWSTSGNTLNLEYNSTTSYTYALDGDVLTLTDFFGDVLGPYSAQAIPSGS